MNLERFSGWTWRNFGHSLMNERTAARQAAEARLLAESVGLVGSSERRPVSEWLPWAKCNAAEFRAAGVGVA